MRGGVGFLVKEKGGEGSVPTFNINLPNLTNILKFKLQTFEPRYITLNYKRYKRIYASNFIQCMDSLVTIKLIYGSELNNEYV